jgi:hypothetical protein
MDLFSVVARCSTWNNVTLLGTDINKSHFYPLLEYLLFLQPRWRPIKQRFHATFTSMILSDGILDGIWHFEFKLLAVLIHLDIKLPL